MREKAGRTAQAGADGRHTSAAIVAELRHTSPNISAVSLQQMPTKSTRLLEACVTMAASRSWRIAN